MLAVSHPEVSLEVAEERDRKSTPPDRDRPIAPYGCPYTPPVFAFRRQLAAFVLHGSALSDTRSALELDQCLLCAMERMHLTEPKLAHVFELYFFAGTAHAAIAEALEISVEESQARLQAARGIVAQDLGILTAQS